MERIPLSVIIPVSKDLQIKACLESIDAPVEVVVVLNNQPSAAVVKIVEQDKRCRLIYVADKGCNLAKVFNIGIKAATYQKIVLTNSDCRFTPQLLRKIYFGLDDHEVVKAQVDFEHNNYGQFLVSESRRLFHQVFDSGTKLFGPGLAFRKEIVDKIGGYFFSEPMGWGEDGDLSKRIHQAGLKLLILEEKIKHGGESIIHDLRVAWKIGHGNRIKEKLAGVSYLRAFLADTRHLITDHHQQFRTAYHTGGFQLLFYFLLWKVAFHLGYYISCHTKFRIKWTENR